MPDWELVRRHERRQDREGRQGARAVDQIGHAAWACADPGVQFHDTINAWHTCPEDGPIRASNPCSEYMFLDDTACNLASMNLLTFRRTASSTSRRTYTRRGSGPSRSRNLGADGAVPEPQIAELSYRFRTLGLGYANIGGLLMTLGHGYNSADGRALCGALTAIMTGEAYATSAEMAGELGAFPGTRVNAAHMLRVIRNHRRAAEGHLTDYEGLAVPPVALDHANCPDSALLNLAHAVWDEALNLGEKHGFRNAQVTVIAPTGTIGLLMDCDTTGIEPDFALVKFKKLAGGGYFKIINQSVPPALVNLGYRPAEVEEIVAYAVGHGTLRRGARDQSDRADRARLRAGGDRADRGGAAGGLRHPLRLQPVDARRGVLHRRARHPEGEAARPGLRPPAPPRLQPGADRGRERRTSAAR